MPLRELGKLVDAKPSKNWAAGVESATKAALPAVKIIKFAPMALKESLDLETYASLSWSIRMGYPRASVYLNDKKDDDFDYAKLIIAPTNAVTINTFINSALKMVDAEPNSEFKLKCYNVAWVDDVKTDDIVLQATLSVGKNSEGIIYISVTKEGLPEVRFRLTGLSKWHVVADANGKDIKDPERLSRMHAKAYFDRLKALMDKYVIDED